MKKLTLLALIVLVLSACSAQPELAETTAAGQNLAAADQDEPVNPTWQPLTSDILNADFEDATSIRNQLAYGTLLLEDTELAITVEQARVLLPLYQALVSLTGDAGSVSEEVNAVQNQILESMTQAQLAEIAALQITNTVLNDFYLENGVTMPNLDPESTRVPGSGMGKNMDQDSREATRTAMGITEPGSGTGEGQGTGQQGRTLLFEKVIALLTARLGE